MGDGEFRARSREREHGPAGATRSRSSSGRTRACRSRPVAETASGGELSRIALALARVAHAGAGEPTIVFDEIDAGIGGRTAHAVAEPSAASPTRQVLTITHLPQIASAAETALPRREGARRPDPHAHRAAWRRRRARRGGANAGRRRVPRRCAAVSFVEFTGPRGSTSGRSASSSASARTTSRSSTTRPRPDLRRGAPRATSARRRQRLAVDQRALPERRARSSSCAAACG